MRQFDIILFGATSFVGAILTKYMLSQQPLDGDVKWAIAGRSQTKLNQLKLSLGEAAEALPVIVADTCNPASINAMCGATRVIVSTVGPYALYGEPVIQSCVDPICIYEESLFKLTSGRVQHGLKATIT